MIDLYPDVTSRIVPTDAAALAPGTVIGRYVVTAPIGEGGMGMVYAARDPHLGRRVAIKVLHAESPSEDVDLRRARLMREGQAMARLTHPNVVAVHDLGVEDDEIFVAMELVAGQTLRAWMRTPRTWREVVAVLGPAAQGLAAAHAARLVHRDFKPENVLIGGDGRVRVGDFGIARLVGAPPSEGADRLATPLSRTGAVLGTPAYMSPEQHRGAPADARSDQFSFCVVLYEALFRQHPFRERDDAPDDGPGTALASDRASTTVRLATAVLCGRVRPPPARPAVPRWLRALVVRGLAPDPEARFPSMQALLDELARGRRARRSVMWAGAGAVVAGMAAVAAMVA